jgi:heme/copper-type cytochrome/quinol oxidase subunit 4
MKPKGSKSSRLSHPSRTLRTEHPAKPSRSYRIVFPLFAVALTAIAFIPTLNNDFVNWDDIIYVMNNNMIRSVTTDNLQQIFSSYYMGNYHPLVLLSFMLDYNLFEMDPVAYHVHNLLIHLINTLLVFCFVYRLLQQQAIPAFITALLFGIHPMHVESVAWISERKDLLYTAWFLLSAITYLFYIDTSKKSYLFLSILFFLLSLLSKAQAVTLPLVMVAIDWYRRRPFRVSLLLEKAIPFLLALGFGILAIYAQKEDKALNPVKIQIIDSLFFGQYSLGMYLYKFLFPFNLCAFHTYPLTPEGRAPLWIYGSPLILIILVLIIMYSWKKYSWAAFGMIFFIVTIFPVLQFFPVGQAVVAERYSYVPYIGLSVIASMLFLLVKQRLGNKTARQWFMVAGCAVVLLFVILTMRQGAVWNDSISLWTKVLKQYPRNISAYVNRGFIYNQVGRHQEAIIDCETGIRIDSSNYKFYVNRAVAWRKLGDNRKAMADYTKAIELEPENWEARLDRGILYTDVFNEYDKGISDFRHFLRIQPKHANGMFNLGVAFLKKGEDDSAYTWCMKSLELDPSMGMAHYVCAVILARKGLFDQAYREGVQAMNNGFQFDKKELEEWRKRSSISQMPELK